MSGEYEVAVSRYTFVEGAMQRPLMQLGPRVVTGDELREMLASYQLRYIQPTLLLNKALAIGSPNVAVPDSDTEQGLSTYFGMIVRNIDGDAADAEHIPRLVETFGLELRDRFIRGEQAPASQQPR